jgi:nucleotide-binding universal stress UspA family protein
MMTEITAENQSFTWPVTFKRIATAIAFSPTSLAILHEAIRITRRFKAELLLIHVGEKTDESEAIIQDLLSKAECDPNRFQVVWKDSDPANAILEACKEHNVDLLIAGALQKENLVQFYRGSVARKLCRKANCSLLLVTHPEESSTPCKNIVVNGLDHPKTADTIRTAFYVADAFQSDELTIVEEVDPAKSKIKPTDSDELSMAKANRKKAGIARKEHHRLTAILDEIPKPHQLNVKERCIFGKKGYSISHYTETSHADLLVMNSPDTKLGFMDRVFTHDLEYILSDLPSDLLIVHTTRKK